MKLENNLLIRNTLKDCHMPYWMLADLMKIHRTTLSERLRHELPAKEQKRIVKMIREEAKRRNDLAG